MNYPGLHLESGKLLNLIAVSSSDLQSLSAGFFDLTEHCVQYCKDPSLASLGESCCQAANVQCVKCVILKSKPLRAHGTLRQQFTFKVASLTVLTTSCDLALPLTFPPQKVIRFTFWKSHLLLLIRGFHTMNHMGVNEKGVDVPCSLALWMLIDKAGRWVDHQLWRLDFLLKPLNK